MCSAPQLIEARNGTARARTNFMVARIMHTGETMLFATGRYEDRIVLDGSEAQLCRKDGHHRQPAGRHPAGDPALTGRRA